MLGAHGWQVAERQAGRSIMVESKGASAGGHAAMKGQHAFSWRDAMDIPVRWRQLSEPNDQVGHVLGARQELYKGCRHVCSLLHKL